MRGSSGCTCGGFCGGNDAAPAREILRTGGLDCRSTKAGVGLDGVLLFSLEIIMRRPVSTLTMAACFAAASFLASSNGFADDSVYSPTLDTPLQRFTAPEDSARPGESFFNKAVTALSKEDYGFAVNMYRVSASWAFKPAQYNLGVMYFNGEGVPADRALGMAWLALAAERDDKAYAAARDAAYAKMSGEEFERANVLWREMRGTYGDERALKRAKARWLQVRRAATGSHLGEGTGHLSVGGKSGYGRNYGLQGSTLADSRSAFGILGGGSVDGSEAYARLRKSDDPYDIKLKQPNATATVKDIIPIGDGVKSTPPAGKPSNFY